ncbi:MULTISPECIES: SpvB/TcaC N-terminal domain-containing protein [unclassified Anaeromyxobacter]|uniref:SpvB/TcaC N-terminal domain-containing protein n=1 Tax=unclassified Anaeromyxobacter TaxID=2620896 RepID=UPI001F59BBFC|nr:MULTISPECIES: SpvB/TcaC N-terminal domain-containing protein [unclassified Anaeromyxobacter]
MVRTNRNLPAACLIALAAFAGCSRSSAPEHIVGPTMRLSPVSVQGGAGTDLFAVADRDTTTGTPVSGLLDVVVRFDHAVEIRAVKVRGDGLSVAVPGQGELPLTGSWGAISFPAPVVAKELTVRVSGAGTAAILQELEVWGAGRKRSPRSVAAMAEATRADATAFEDVRVLGATPAAATLDPTESNGGARCLKATFPRVEVAGARRAYLAYEANVPRAFALERILDGDAVTGGFWVGNVATPRTLVDELDPERLGTASGVTLCVPPDATGKVQVAGLRLLVVSDDGLDVFDRETHLKQADAVDGEATPSPVSGTVELTLDRPIALDDGSVRLGSAPLTLAALELRDASGWDRVPDVELATESSTLPVAGREASALRLVFPSSARADVPAASVAEISVAGSGVGPRVGAARIVLTAPHLTFEGGREVGERFGDRAWIAGWAESPAGVGRVEIGGAEVGVAGVFGVALDRPAAAPTPWTVDVKATFPDGTTVVRTVVLERDGAAELLTGASGSAALLSDAARFGQENQTGWGTIDPDAGGKVMLGTDVTFEAGPGAVGKRTNVGITRKGPEFIPPLDAGMVNVTAPANGAYRFLPKGQKFAKPVRVGLPYDPSLLPEGIAPEEIQTWFYDEAAEQWTALPRAELQRSTNRVVSETTHFTFMINAVLVLPEHPGPSSFNPNSIKDLKASDPSAAIDLIAPPGVNNLGTAQLAFPIRLPAGRGGYQPELRLAYDSGGSNGWLGVGWELPSSSVQIDTRFGAPEYGASEPRYLLDGEQLVPTSESPRCEDGSAGTRYRARVEKSFRRILRCGTGPTDHWFQVQDKQGNLYVYGRSGAARLTSYEGLANIGAWYLERVVDTNGNLTQFVYDTDAKARPTVRHPQQTAATHEEDFRQLYLSSIQYTGRAYDGARDPFGTAEIGHYHVELRSEQDTRGRYLDRPDEITSGRLGFKTVLRRRLKSILVQLDRDGRTDTIREYRFSYERKAESFWKSRLTKVEVFGAGEGTARKLFHTHAFSWFDADYRNSFAAPVAWSFKEAPDDLSLSHAEESGWSIHGYGGIGFTYDKITGTVGARVGRTQHRSVTNSLLLDVNGDGLPDRVTGRGGSYDVRFNSGSLVSGSRELRRALPAGDPGDGEVASVPLPTLGKEEGKGWNTAGQASYGPVSVNAGYSHFSSKTTEFLGDADGDGLVDVVQESGVLLNQHRSGTAKAFAFAPMVTGTSLASTPTGANPDQEALEQSIREQLKPSDAVLEWIAPFTGRVDVAGNLFFVDHAQPSPLPAERDGVRIQAFVWDGSRDHAAVKVFERVKTLADAGVPTPVGIANLDVFPGLRVFFVLSTLADFPVDRAVPSPLEDVHFSPTISYSHLGPCSVGACRPLSDEEQGRVDPSGAATFQFDQASDFRIAGQPAPSVAIPATGALRIETSLVKKESTDDVRVCVQRFAQKAEVKDLRCEEKDGGFDTLIDEILPADAVGKWDLAATASVLAGEKLVFRIQTDLPVDPAVVDWTIGGRMETAGGLGPNGCEAPPPELAEAMSFTGDAWFPVHNAISPRWYLLPNADVSAAPDDRPIEPWVAPEPGTIRVFVNPKYPDPRDPRGYIPALRVGDHASDALYVAARTAKSLIVKRRFDQLYGSPYESIIQELHVDAGERVFFEIFSDAQFDATWTPVVTFVRDATGLSSTESVKVNERYSSYRSGSNTYAVRSRFGGGHHLFHYGTWRAANDQDLDPRRLYKKVDAYEQGEVDVEHQDPDVKDTTEVASPLVPRRLGTWVSQAEPGLAPRVPSFVSREGTTFISAGIWHASREGEFVQQGGGAGETTSLMAMFALGPALRQSEGDSTSLSAGVSVGPVGVSLNVATGASYQKTDVLDMNGDRVVDVVSRADDGTAVRVTDIRDPGRPGIQRGTEGFRLRVSKDGSASLGLGVSDPWRRMSDDGVVKALVAMYPSVGGGIGVNFSSTERELADVNGDGLPDEVSRDGGYFLVRLNLGSHFAASADRIPVGSWSEGNLDELIGSLGSALPDEIVSPERVRKTTSISLNANAGFTLYENYGASVNWDSSVAATGISLADVNGDGLPDYVRKTTGTSHFTVRLNNGFGFDDEVQLPVQPWPASVTKPWLRDTGLAAGVNKVLRLVNGDTPSVDAVEASGTYGELPSIGFVVSWGVGPLSPAMTPWLHFSVGGDKTFKRVSGFALGLQDMDGDGLADHVLKAEKNPGGDNEAVWVRLNQLRKGNLLKAVSRPLGGSFELDYARKGNSVAMPESRWVLSSVVVHDGRADGTPGHDLATSFDYGDGRYHRYERDFLGFDATTETRGDGAKVVRTYWNDSVLRKGLVVTETLSDVSGRVLTTTTNAWSAPSRFADTEARPAPAVDPCREAAPFFLRPTLDEWCGSHVITLDSVTQELHETTGDPNAKLVTYQSYTYDRSNGNVLTFTDLGDADPLDTGDDVHATVNYADDEAARAFYSIARPELLLVKAHATDADDAFLRKRIGHYDARGNLKDLQSFVDATRYVQVDLAWNADGKLFEVHQPRVKSGRYWVRYLYDTSGVTRNFPTRVEDAHGYASSAVYDERFGEVETATDLNGNLTRRVLDANGRIFQVFGPYDSTIPAVRVEYAPDASPARAATHNLLPRNGGWLDTFVYTDGLGRTLQTQKTVLAHGKGLGVTASGRQRFDVMGRVTEQGIPYFIGGRDPGFREDAPVYETTTTYDVLGRKTRTVEPNGGVYELTYDLARAAKDPFLRRRATVVDPLRKTRVMYRRLDEKISAVEEHIDSLVHTTRYQYDPLGDLRAVIDARGNETRVEYDRLGRRRQLVSPDAGTTDFAYDDMGNLVSRQDGNLVQAAKGGKLPADQAFVFYEYDLDQLIAVNKPFGTDVKYEYGPPGAPENGAGRIVRVVDDAGAETRGYGKLGETIRFTRTVKPLKPNDSPQTFETRFEFDSFGRMLRLWYPDGEELTYLYDAAGLVNHAEGHRPATKHWEEATEVYLTTLTYDEFGARRHAVLGNAATTTWTYEPDTQRLKHVDTASQGRTLQALTYTYDLVGNVKTLTNALGEATGRRSGAVSYTYDYDDLYRLTTATGTALSRPGVVDRFKTTYEFGDEIHNMTRLHQKHWLTTANDPDDETAHPPHTNHDFDYAYGDAGPHQATKIGDRNLVYDANGNTLRECRDHGDAACQANSDKLRRYFWGEENELNAVIDGGGWNITRFMYDAGGQRVVKLGRGGESITIGQFFALKGRKAATKHIFIGETRVASKLLPSPGWEPSWSEGTAVSGPILAGTAVETVSGCDPSTYQPQKCPIDPAANPVIDRRPDTTKIKPATYYYHSDHLGSTSWVTDQNGRVHEHVEYFPYGEVWRDARYDSDGDPVHRQQFLFSSKEMDEETGLYYFGARYLDPVRARWASSDPMLASYLPGQEVGESLPGRGGIFRTENLSLYLYAHASPVVLQDPDGNEVRVDFHEVARGSFHSLVRITPENQARWANDPRFRDPATGQPLRDDQGRVFMTLGAGPVPAINGSLVSEHNRTRDARPHQGGIVVPNPADVKAGPLGPGDPVGEDQFIDRLLTLDANYADDLDYDLFPEANPANRSMFVADDGFNSNSYVSGLLEAAGVAPPVLPVSTPGYDRPVPRASFAPNGAGQGGGAQPGVPVPQGRAR